MRNLSERQRLILTIAVVALLAGGLVALILSDRQEIARTEEEVAALDERIRASEVEIRRTKDREDRVLVFRAVEDRELAVLPTRQKIAEFHSNLSLFLSSAGVRFRELPESTAVESDLAKGIYVTRSTVTCEGDAASILKLVNMLENDPRLVAVKGMRIQAGDRDPDRPEEPVPHEVELTLETYFYNPAAGAAPQQVPVPGAERRLEEPDLKDAIASFQPERPDTYVLRPAASRRDPFVDPRRVKVQEDPEALAQAFAEQEPVVIDLENRLRDLGEKDEQAKALDGVGDLFRRDRIEAEIETNLNELVARLGQVQQLKTVTVPALQQRVSSVQDRLEGLRGRRPAREMIITRTVAETTLADVVQAYEAGDLGEVETLATEWQQFLRGKQVDADAASVVEEIGRYRTKSKTIAEFQTRGIRVTGTIQDRENPQRSIAVVNGRSLRPGDRLDDEGSVIVGSVGRDGVDFHFQGEVIRVPRNSGSQVEGVGRRGKPSAAPAPRTPAMTVSDAAPR